MSARWTFALVAIAAALGAWVYFGELQGDVRKQERETAEKRAFGAAPASVTAFELSLPDGKEARVSRDGTEGWKLEKPVVYPADKDTVDRLLHVLEKVQSTSTISPAPTDLAPFGLGPDAHPVRVFTGEGEPKLLTVGRPTPVGGGRYLSVAADPGRIFVVNASDVYGLSPTLIELRDKRLLKLSTGSIDDLTVRAAGALVAHAKRGEKGWEVVEPAASLADGPKIDRALEELALARATDFADTADPAASAAVAQPEVEVVVRAGETEERLAFGRAADKTWLSRAGDPVLLAVSPAAVTAIPARPFDYRAKRVQTLEPEKVKALELVYPRAGVTHRFELQGNDWKPTETGVELRPLKVEDMLLAVAALDATGVEPTGVDRKALGLEPPVVTLRVLDGEAHEIGVLSLGDASADRGIPAFSTQSPEVWRVSNDVGGEVPLSPEAYTNLFVKPPDAAPAPPAPSSP